MQSFIRADTKSNSTDSHAHVTVDEHPADDPAKFHWKFWSMAGEEFDAIVSKTHGSSSPLRWVQYRLCGTVESFYTFTWSETRRHSEDKLCDTASDPLGFIGPFFSGVHLYGDPGYEIRRLLGITEEYVNSVRQGGHITKVLLQSIKQLRKAGGRNRTVLPFESQVFDFSSEALPEQPSSRRSQGCGICPSSCFSWNHYPVPLHWLCGPCHHSGLDFASSASC